MNIIKLIIFEQIAIMEQLIKDIFCEILNNLDIEDIDNFRHTCKYFGEEEFTDTIYRYKICKSDNIMLLYEESCRTKSLKFLSHLFNNKLSDFFLYAVENGYNEVIKILLLNTRIDVAKNNNKYMRVAAEKQHLEICSLFIINDTKVQS